MSNRDTLCRRMRCPVGMISGLALTGLCGFAALAQQGGTLQLLGDPKRVLPVKIGWIGPNDEIIEWRDYLPRGDCDHRLVFDCFEPNLGQCPDRDLGDPIGFWSCGEGDPEACGHGASNRWYFGETYCNPYSSNDMQFDDAYAGEYVTRFEVGWHWDPYPWSENMAVVVETYEAFDDTCQEGDPDHQGEFLGGVVLNFGETDPHYWFADVELCGLEWLRLPADGAGSYNVWLLTYEGEDPTWPDDYVLATCAQPMLWGVGIDEDWDPPGSQPDADGRGEMSIQGPIQWDDDVITDGWHTAPDECDEYTFPQYNLCPDPLGAMACFFVALCSGDVDGDGETGQSDMGILLADWGCLGDCVGDLNGDGETGQPDLGILLADWGCGTD